MPSVLQEYQQRLTTPEDAVQLLQSDTNIALGVALNQPPALMGAIAQRLRAGSLHNLRLYYQNAMQHMADTVLADDVLHTVYPHTFFLTEVDRRIVKQQRATGKKILSYVPAYFYQTPRLFTDFIKLDACLITVSPMDKGGYFSFGTNNDWSSTAIRNCKHAIIEVNPHMPRVFGDALLHVTEVDKIVEYETPLLESGNRDADPRDEGIGKAIAELVPNGATLQFGIGGIPNAVCRFLANHRDLGIHSELLTPSMAALVEAGVVNGRRKTLHRWKHVFTLALGNRALFDFMDDNSAVESYPVSYNNEPSTIARNHLMTSVNSALEIDLYGQVSAESIGWHEFSGTGGALDFMRGAFESPNGHSFLALYATAKNETVSRIVPRLTSLVTDPRMDTEYVVTEYGVTNLKGKSTRERALSLIDLAHPKFREELLAEAQKMTLI